MIEDKIIAIYKTVITGEFALLTCNGLYFVIISAESDVNQESSLELTQEFYLQKKSIKDVVEFPNN